MLWGALLEVKLRLAVVLRDLNFYWRVGVDLQHPVLAVMRCCETRTRTHHPDLFVRPQDNVLVMQGPACNRHLPSTEACRVRMCFIQSGMHHTAATPSGSMRRTWIRMKGNGSGVGAALPAALAAASRAAGVSAWPMIRLR